MAATKCPLVFRHWVQWQYTTGRSEPRTWYFTAPQRQLPVARTGLFVCMISIPQPFITGVEQAIRYNHGAYVENFPTHWQAPVYRYVTLTSRSSAAATAPMPENSAILIHFCAPSPMLPGAGSQSRCMREEQRRSPCRSVRERVQQRWWSSPRVSHEYQGRVLPTGENPWA